MKILGLLIAVVISGCSSLAGYYEADPLFNQQSDLLKDDEDIVDVFKLQNRVTEATTKDLRNELIQDLLTISDRSCARHQASIIAGLNTWNVATGSVSNLLSAVATVAGGESAKAALSAGAGFTNSSRSLVNEEVYAKAIGTTIVRATMVAREKQAAVISKGMQSPLPEYSVKEGLRDVYNYQNKCSFYYGLVEITMAIEQRKRSRPELLDLISLLKQQATDLKSRGISTTEIEEKLTMLTLELDGAPQ
ncbi:MAG: hypothetical protein WEA82_08965 [Idiomarina sp.]